MTNSTDKYAVLGNPIEHSQSPAIHQQFAKQTGQVISYSKQLIELDAFEQMIDKMIADGFKGFNVTVPFKEEAYQKADALSRRARQAGAVNTLMIRDDGSIEGDNTDGVGMISDIRNNHGWVIADKTVLLLGAGGAVRGVLGPLLSENPKKVVICNRTFSKAESLAIAFSKEGNIDALSFDALDNEKFDLVINGTSASLSGEVLPIPSSCITAATHCYDMMYSEDLTVFLRWAKDNGASQLADGLGMLVSQAAESFRLWRGVCPDVAPVINSLKK